MDARLNEYGQRIDEHGRRIVGLEHDVYGDVSRHHPGLVERVTITEEAVEAISACQHDMKVRYEVSLTIAKVVLAILAATGIGVWWPILSAAFQQIQ